MKLKKLLQFGFVLVFLFLLIKSQNSKVKAESNFSQKVKAVYSIGTDSSTVKYSFTTTNKIANNYLQNFSLKLPFEPKNITSKNSPVPVKVTNVSKINDANLYNVNVDILQPITGKDKSFDWNFEFQTTDLLVNHGSQKAIIVPGFNQEENISSYDIQITVPNSIGTIQYIYGEPQVFSSLNESIFSYSSVQKPSLNYVLLFGDGQDYSFDTIMVQKETLIDLPESNEYQEVVFNEIPKRQIAAGERVDSKKFNLKPNEKISAEIKTSKNYDKKYNKEFTSIENSSLIDLLSTKISNNSSSKYETARNIFDYLTKNYELSDFLTTRDSQVALDISKKKVNPLELNSLFRQLLTKSGIENRGDYGYVFPFSKTEKERLSAEPHVWSEFWDGEKWIVVDPTWTISSKGTDYFDKNNFNHIKFSSYQNLNQVKNFFSGYNLSKVSALKEKSNTVSVDDIKLLSNKVVTANKEYSVILENNSNVPLKVNYLLPFSQNSSVQTSKNRIQVDEYLFPRSKVEVAIPLRYGLITNSTNSSLNIGVIYSLRNSSVKEKEFISDLKMSSNLSRYLAPYLLLFMTTYSLCFIIFSFTSFAIHKTKLNKYVQRYEMISGSE